MFITPVELFMEDKDWDVPAKVEFAKDVIAMLVTAGYPVARFYVVPEPS